MGNNKEFIRAKNKDFVDSILKNVGKKEEIIKLEPLFNNVDESKVEEKVRSLIGSTKTKK